MFQVFEYYGRYQGLRSRVTGLPAWARAVLVLAALPGVLLIALSIVALLVSLLALLVLTVPVYRLLTAIMPKQRFRNDRPAVEPYVHAPRRHVDVKIVE